MRIFKFSWAILFSLFALAATPARAVPAFAVQTGQPCQACHVGGFGPQLKPFGREFKLRGYTMRSNSFNLPLSAMAIGSFNNTRHDQAAPPEPNLKTNNNFTLDQFSIFFAGGLGSHLGAFIQTTYDGIAKAWSWDNVDVRTTTSTQVKGADVLLGLSLNNSPAVQDVWNTLPAWGYPYTGSGVAPSPSAAPLLAGGLAQNTLGLTGYVWINAQLYFEVGGYTSPRARTLTWLGADPYAPGDLHGLAPYGRIAFQKNFGNQTIEVGASGMHANINPARDRSTGEYDSYSDLGLDASYILTRDNSDVVTLNARYYHERQQLNASRLLGNSGNVRNSLNDFRADASYYWHDKVGGTVGVFKTTGSTDTILFGSNRTYKPNSSGMMLQVDGTPFGDAPMGGRANIRVGAQYTIYNTFEGARTNFDGAGANASDNNTLRIFAWLAF